MPKAKPKKNETEGNELRRQFYLIAVTGIIIGKLLSGTTTRKPRKKNFKKRDYFTPQQYFYRRRIKKAQRWARYGTESWLREKWRRARNQMRGY